MSTAYDNLFASAGQQYGVDPNLLKAVAQQESGFNPKAISDKGAVGLMQIMPATAQALGVDPTDPAQAVPGAARLLKTALDNNNGDVNKALMTYHGGPNTSIWGPKTQAYPGQVLAHMPKPQTAIDPVQQFLSSGGQTSTSSTPTANASSTYQPTAIPTNLLAQNNDPVQQFLTSGGQSPAAAPQQPVPNGYVTDKNGSFDPSNPKNSARLQQYKIAAIQNDPTLIPPSKRGFYPTLFDPKTGAQLSPTTGQPQNQDGSNGASPPPQLFGWKHDTNGYFDAGDPGNAARLAASQGTSVTRNRFGDIVQSSQITPTTKYNVGDKLLAGAAAGAGTVLNAVTAPVLAASDIVGHPLPTPWSPPAGSLAAEYTQNIGDAAHTVGLDALPFGSGELNALSHLTPQAAQQANRIGASKAGIAPVQNSLSGAINPQQGSRIEPTLQDASVQQAPTTAQVPAPLANALTAAMQAKPRLKLSTSGQITPVTTPTAPVSEVAQPAATPTTQPVSTPTTQLATAASPTTTGVAAQTTPVPPGASVTPVLPGASGVTDAPSVTFTPPAKVTDPRLTLPPDIQSQNIATLKAIGLDSQRSSAISGNPKAAGTEYQQAKLNTPQGDVMSAQLNTEQQALKNYGQKLIQDTGATASTPESAGQAIRTPLQGLADHYDQAIGSLYDKADVNAKALGAHVETTNLDNLMNNPGFKETLLAQDKQSLLDATSRQLDRFKGNLPDEPNAPEPLSVPSAERFRQWLNQQYKVPGNAPIIGQLKQALDADVTKVGGAGVYDQARALHAEMKNTLENPNGMSALLTEDGPNGVNQKIPDERLSDRLLAMPNKQFSQITNTLKNLPPELQDQGNAALAEVKAALLRKVYAAGDSGGTQAGQSAWNAANVTRTLNSPALNGKLNILSPNELANLQTLHDAGHLLQTPSSYPGAAVQGHNLVQKGLIYAPQAAGAAAGAYLGGPVGAMAGGTVGGMLTAKMAQRAEVQLANKLQTQLQNPKIVPPSPGGGQ